jgi:uncharacterized protein (TIGR03084 family)
MTVHEESRHEAPRMVDELLADLATESAQLRTLVAGLSEDQWRTPTPAPGWDVATQIAHLAWTDECTVTAATDKARWDGIVEQALADPEGFVDRSALAGGAVPPAQLLGQWDAARAALADVLRSATEKLPWFGPPMSPTSMATARFMETWAHGLDIHDALGAAATPSDRIRHVCHLGVRTRGFAYAANGEQAPATEVRVELIAPSGAIWTWGPEDAEQRVAGPAWDFARLVTQRVHRDDTVLAATGEDADHWLSIAQAFAGPPGKGRPRA